MNFSEMMPTVTSILTRRQRQYGDVLIKACLFRDADKWLNAAATIVPQMAGQKVSPRKPLLFPSMVFVDEVISLKELLSRLSNISTE
jgi:hypothetical protein